MKRFLFLAPIVAFVAVLVAFFAGLGRDPSTLPSVYLGKPLPAFAAPPLRPGDIGLTNEDLDRGEPVLLNAFASWCGPCRYEHPVFLKLRREGVAIHGLNWKDRPEDGQRWLAERGDPYIRLGSDPTGRTGIELGVAGVPETFVIDKRGRVRYRHVGAVTPEVWDQKIGPLMAKLRAES
ncbi:MAG: DsbE family thiol:disulfide interchange protein [Phenylobacterium sp.]|uniref:DsbE family thiol:disulfide interchange protein n=1 Tax=Phenylobacterium sp. TaxID=1871053 RepID=UPI001A60AF0C|nr:DsbE family thiol:disulfide interchange protein [Phenylobacterium sp.]MBL8553398.1 DsbE family thiol:disulfide interchange protein [Phenylobacterium sp.]